MRQVKILDETFIVAEEPSDFWGWVEKGNYNREWCILHDHLKPEHTFIDLGAWVGSHSLYASRIAKRVIAVEPDPVAFAILTANIAANCPKHELYRLAVGKAGNVTLGSGLLGASTTRANRHEGGGIGAWEPGQEFSISSVTLRNFVESAHADDPLFVKIDVEGSEEHILTDLDFFKEHHPTVYLELHPFWWTQESKTYQDVANLVSLYSEKQLFGKSMVLIR